MRLPLLDSSGLGNLQVTVHLADADDGGTNFDGGEDIEVQVAFDGAAGGTNLTGGTYTTIGRFTGVPGGGMRQDTNLDGSATDPADLASPTLSSILTPYTFDISGTGSLLSVQVVVRDPSTGHRHALTVPPRFAHPRSKRYGHLGERERIHAAIAWTFNLRAADYRPDIAA